MEFLRVLDRLDRLLVLPLVQQFLPDLGSLILPPLPLQKGALFVNPREFLLVEVVNCLQVLAVGEAKLELAV